MAAQIEQRDIFNTWEQNKIMIIQHGTISEDYAFYLKVMGCLCPCSCLCCNEDAIKASTYVQVMENRLEWNYPVSVGCRVFDNQKVLYYDRSLAVAAGKAGMCSPMCTHNTCCPTCFDMCGEALIIYGSDPGMCSKTGAFVGQTPGCLCCHSFVFLPGLANAQELADAFNDVRTNRMLNPPKPPSSKSYKAPKGNAFAAVQGGGFYGFDRNGNLLPGPQYAQQQYAQQPQYAQPQQGYGQPAYGGQQAYR